MKRFLFIVLLLGTVAASARRTTREILFGTVAAGSRTTTWNIRLGAGMQGSFADNRYYLDVGDMILSPALGMEFLLQPNIGLGDKKKWVFAPALQVVLTIHDEPSCLQLSAPLLFGYRIKTGNRVLFVPKIGPYVGIVGSLNNDDYGPVVGPMLDLAFEFGHFVVGLDAYYSFISQVFEYRYTSPGSKSWDYNYKRLSHEFNSYGVNITFGYKF